MLKEMIETAIACNFKFRSSTKGSTLSFSLADTFKNPVSISLKVNSPLVKITVGESDKMNNS